MPNPHDFYFPGAGPPPSSSALEAAFATRGQGQRQYPQAYSNGTLQQQQQQQQHRPPSQQPPQHGSAPSRPFSTLSAYVQPSYASVQQLPPQPLAQQQQQQQQLGLSQPQLPQLPLPNSQLYHPHAFHQQPRQPLQQQPLQQQTPAFHGNSSLLSSDPITQDVSPIYLVKSEPQPQPQHQAQMPSPQQKPLLSQPSAPAPSHVSPSPAFVKPENLRLAHITTRLPDQPLPAPASASANSPRMAQGTRLKPTGRDPRRKSSMASAPASPASSHMSSHAVDTLPILLCVAEECFAQAEAAVQDLARTMSPDGIREHHQLVATGLGCLEAAIKFNGGRLPPRAEARLCLRYASKLVEETTNVSEAETTLTKSISVCEKHRFLDLKYCSQFLLMKTLFQRNQKAALKSINGHIDECTTHKHVHWIYAFRFLLASFHVQSGSPGDQHALDNLRKIANMAAQRDDKAISVVAILLEGLAHLSTMKDDWVTRVQNCIAVASRSQMDASVHLPQIDILLLLLDLACSMHQKAYDIAAQKLTSLQTRLEEFQTSQEWSAFSSQVLLPIRKLPNSASTVSGDTRAVLVPGDHVDHIVLMTLGKREVYALAYMMHGFIALHKAPTAEKSLQAWADAVKLLQTNKTSPPPACFPDALRQADWEKEVNIYAHVLAGMQAATHCEWAKVQDCIAKIKECRPPSGILALMVVYLSGAFCQGTGKLNEALEIWKDPRFDIRAMSRLGRGGGLQPYRADLHLSILAALNRIWIMQDRKHRDDQETADLLALLRPVCEGGGPDAETRKVWHLVLASCELQPPLSGIQIKGHIHNALAPAGNTQLCLSIALSIMRQRLFENMVGEQALKSAKAAAAQARKSGNLLWMSVADGMLAQSFETQGFADQAAQALRSGVQLANEAVARTRL